MNYFLSEELNDIREVCAEIAEKYIIPVRAELDEENRFPSEIIKVMAESDLCGIYIPEAYGGSAEMFGGGSMALCVATEELSRACGGVAVSFAANALGAMPILISGSEEQKQKYLPDLASGVKLAAFALTEPEAGSDAGGVKTKAIRDGDSYVLNGTKQWITNGGEAQIYTVIAQTDPSRGARGLSAFIVEEGTPGFSYGKKEDKMGIRASATRELIFEDCRVPAENLIAREGFGFIVAMKTLDRSRPGVAAQAVGIAQGAMDEAARYASERIQFGKRIDSFQAVQFMLADMATQIEAARALVYSTARMIDAGEKKFEKESAMAKVFASDTAMRVTTDAVQILGGYGYMKEYPVEKMMRDAKITQIYEGTNQIQRSVIASAVIKETASGSRK
ncbi:MAG: acyl-CoA dehydrogenase family protein [Candidatus Fermentibacteraceae bacterium]|nr:acyl-CoA dehydrogenase family protein [Candidatus Fermentibacteraceae bacterium]MBN2608991.1 acyl-CoA dehydrogenase family protein [Candidatus Fermentibacteraceae bacterium]